MRLLHLWLITGLLTLTGCGMLSGHRGIASPAVESTNINVVGCNCRCEAPVEPLKPKPD